MEHTVRLRTRSSRNGKRFTYVIDYIDDTGKRKRQSLGHSDKRKAERQRARKQQELAMGIKQPSSQRLSLFYKDSRARTGINALFARAIV